VRARHFFLKSQLGLLSVLGILLIAAFVIHNVSTKRSEAPKSAAVTKSGHGIEALEDWPTRPITIIAGNRVGGVFDTMARGLAKHLSKELGVPVVVQNISGATAT